MSFKVIIQYQSAFSFFFKKLHPISHRLRVNKSFPTFYRPQKFQTSDDNMPHAKNV